MAIPSLPQIFQKVLGVNADKTTIPDETPSGTGVPSVDSLFPEITAINPISGGKMIQRSWMNGLFHLIGQHLFWHQTGKALPWQSTIDYPVGSHCTETISSVDHEYVCIKQNGPNISGHTNKRPSGFDGTTYWKICNYIPVSTIGSATKPVYLNNGTLVASNANVGTNIKPVYVSNGTLTATNATVGSANNPIFMNTGNIYASTLTVGTASKPVYMNGGTITQCNNMLSNDISGNAATATSAVTASNYANTGTIKTGLDSKLNLSGGTMTGQINVKGHVIGGYDTDRRADINLLDTTKEICITSGLPVGSGEFNGATIFLHGKSTSTSDGGDFVIGAANGVTRKSLTGKPDGTLLWENNDIIRVPKYSSRIDVLSAVAGDGYTTLSAGWVYLHVWPDRGGAWYIYIDGIQILKAIGGDYCDVCWPFALRGGQTIRATKPGGGRLNQAFFYPM